MAIATQYIDFNYKVFFQDFQLIHAGVTKETCAYTTLILNQKYFKVTMNNTTINSIFSHTKYWILQILSLFWMKIKTRLNKIIAWKKKI